MARTATAAEILDLVTFTAPRGFYYSVENHNTQYHSVWLNHEQVYSYTKDKVKTIWGFIRKKDHKICRPINAKKPGKIVDDLSTCTAYSAMEKPSFPLQQFFI